MLVIIESAQSRLTASSLTASRCVCCDCAHHPRLVCMTFTPAARCWAITGCDHPATREMRFSPSSSRCAILLTNFLHLRTLPLRLPGPTSSNRLMDHGYVVAAHCQQYQGLCASSLGRKNQQVLGGTCLLLTTECVSLGRSAIWDIE